MAKPVMMLTAHGHSNETCAACNKTFSRGEQMTAFEDSEGDVLGWVCAECIEEWKSNGEQSKTALALFKCDEQ
jgi:hypothetical protein